VDSVTQTPMTTGVVSGKGIVGALGSRGRVTRNTGFYALRGAEGSVKAVEDLSPDRAYSEEDPRAVAAEIGLYFGARLPEALSESGRLEGAGVLPL
jgi:hypothetical protein